MGKCPCCPGRRRGVTGIALRRRNDVRRWLALGILRVISTRVTGRTLAIQAGVIHRRRYETDEIGVAGVAGGRSRDMAGGFASCVDTVVAG